MPYKFNQYKLNLGKLGLGQLGGGGGPSNPAFIFGVKTDNAGVSTDTQFKLPLSSTGTYNFNVDWGDSSNDDITVWNAAATTHTYSTTGTYTVTITGSLTGFRFNATGDRLKILDISNWGNVNLGNENAQFKSCSNLTVSATDSPTVGTTLQFCFDACPALIKVGGVWDLTGCLSIRSMFDNCVLFNDPNIGSWDVSGVTAANGMITIFDNCTVFNQDLSGWDVSNTTSLNGLFRDTGAFNQDIGAWDTSGITDTRNMFQRAVAFNQDLSDWNTSSVTDTRNMFDGAAAYNQPMATVGSKWDMSNVTLMGLMFSGATSFNQPITSWDVSACTQFTKMFFGATSFNQSIDSWTFILTGNLTFAQMFEGATAYNQSMNSWDLTGVNSMSDMLKDATSFNGNVGSWDFSVADTTSFTGLFDGCLAFNQDLSGWDISTVTSFTNLLRGSTMSTANYDATLIGFSDGIQLSNVTFHGGNATYTNSGAAKTAHDNLTINRNWIITDGGTA